MAEPVQILGTWTDMLETAPRNRMVIEADQLARHWRRVSLTADFWATYGSLNTPEQPSRQRLSRDDVHSVLSYALNELFENCAKFGNSVVKTIYFESWEDEDQIIFQITNHIAPDKKLPFITLLNTLLEGDPSELYFQKIEENAITGHTGSGLGYLTLMMDYGIRFGFRFRPVQEGSMAIDVQAHISMLK